MKQFLKNLARQWAHKPVIGRFVRAAIAFVRFPDLHHRHNVFLNQQLPQLLETLVDLNHRQTRLDVDQENFVKTAPITLRKLTRDVAALREALEKLQTSHSPISVNQIKSVFTTNNKGLRIHLTGGRPPLADYVNIDRRPGIGIDIVSEFDNLPLADSQVQEIRSSRILERFSHEDLRRSLLPCFHRVLMLGGHLQATVTDTEGMIREYSYGVWSFEDLRSAIYGRPSDGENIPRDMLTPQVLTHLLEESGFVDVQVLAQARPNGKYREFEIIAYKRAASHDDRSSQTSDLHRHQHTQSRP